LRDLNSGLRQKLTLTSTMLNVLSWSTAASDHERRIVGQNCQLLLLLETSDQAETGQSPDSESQCSYVQASGLTGKASDCHFQAY